MALKSTALSVGTAASKIVTASTAKASAAPRQTVYVQNTHASANLFIGQQGVTATTGLKLAPGVISPPLSLSIRDELYAIASGAATTGVLVII